MSRVITIHYSTGWIQLLIPDWLDRASMKNIRLALKLIAQNQCDNTETIAELDRFFPDCIEKLKGEWAKASREYRDGYRLFDKWHCSSAEMKAIEKSNRQLLSSVKKAKARYDKMCKIKVLYDALKEKYFID